MTILIVYATNSSGTYMVSQEVSDVLSKQGHRPTVQRANEVDPQEFTKFDLVILGSCTWLGEVNGKPAEGQLQEHMAALVEKSKRIRADHQRFAVFGLGDSSYTNFCAAADHLEKFVAGLGGRLIVPTLRIDGYFFDQDNNDKAVVAWAGSINQALIT